MSDRILCSISTRNRTHLSLQMAIQSVITQTKKPNKIVIFDDNDEHFDLREKNQLYRELFLVLEAVGIEWLVIFGGRCGQHHNHEKANNMGYDWVWRLDDDTFAEPNVLETLCSFINDDVGAIGGSIMTPSFTRSFNPEVRFSGELSKIDSDYNIQWILHKSPIEVEHLHCSFLYRAGVHHYNLNLSKVAHREETIFTHGLYRKGYKLLVVPGAVTWHLKLNEGGIRSDNQAKYYDLDEDVFQKFLKNENSTVVVLDCGRGDHICFKNMMHEIENPIIFSCYPEIVPGRSIADAIDTFVNINRYNIYERMDEWQWKDSLENAFRKLYCRQV